MGKSAPTDPELLAEWLERRREDAFHALVDRYAGLVLMSARRTCGDDSMAAEASQLTFILLARKASSLLACPSLGGWLHRAALLHSKNLMRSARREDRKRQLLHATMERLPSSAIPEPSWSDLQPVIDEALSSLPDKDREALLLRFYRSLGVREIGEILGISTDAAQKRIDRATARLRAQLTRRGCQAGTAFGAVMLAGFATDAQAAAPVVSMLATKALAATAAGGATAAGSSTIITALSMKASSYVLPAALLLAVAWVASQRLSMAKLEEENAMLSSKIGEWTPPTSAATRRLPIKTALDKRPIDWNEVARELGEDDGSGGKAFLTSKLRLHEGFLSMSREELLAALDEAGATNLGGWQKKTLMTRLYRSLLEKDPEAALNHALAHYSSDPWQPNAEILGYWAAKDPKSAVAWLDARIAAGIAEKSLTERLGVRVAFERALVSSLISTDVEQAGLRVAALPKSERAELFMIEDIGPRDWIKKVKPEDLPAFARLVREQVPQQRLKVLSEAINGRQSPTDLAQMHDYLQGIEATADERKACLMDMLRPPDNPFLNLPPEPGEAGTRKISSDDLNELRTWIGQEAPELVEAATGQALAALGGTVRYEDLVELALEYHAASGNDEVILPLLYQPRDPRLARSLVAKLFDPIKREEILRMLDDSFEVK